MDGCLHDLQFVETGKTPVLRDWDFGIDGGRYIRFVIKSSQLRLILVKGEDKDQGRSQEIANYRSLFLRSWIIRFFRRK